MASGTDARRVWVERLVFIAGLVLLCVLIAHGQDNEPIRDETKEGFSVFRDLALTFMYAAISLALTAAALGVTLAYLRLPVEIDQDFIIWIVSVWLGGFILNALVCKLAAAMTHTAPLSAPWWLATLLALPCLFGWTVLMSTRNFADLTLKDAIRVAVVVAVVCAPWFGTPWRFRPAPPPAISQRVIAPAQVTAHVSTGTHTLSPSVPAA